MNINRFIGIPFIPFGRDWDGVDCWGLVYLWHKEWNKQELPQYAFAPNTTQCSAVMVAETAGPTWSKVIEPKLGDVAVFNVFNKPMHVGLMLNEEQMLHIEKGIDSVIENITNTRWMKRLYGIYRYV